MITYIGARLQARLLYIIIRQQMLIIFLEASCSHRLAAFVARPPGSGCCSRANRLPCEVGSLIAYHSGLGCNVEAPVYALQDENILAAEGDSALSPWVRVKFQIMHYTSCMQRLAGSCSSRIFLRESDIADLFI